MPVSRVASACASGAGREPRRPGRPAAAGRAPPHPYRRRGQSSGGHHHLDRSRAHPGGGRAGPGSDCVKWLWCRPATLLRPRHRQAPVHRGTIDRLCTALCLSIDTDLPLTVSDSWLALPCYSTVCGSRLAIRSNANPYEAVSPALCLICAPGAATPTARNAPCVEPDHAASAVVDAPAFRRRSPDF